MPDGSPWPRVSIVTPSFNQGQFIEETIRSVLLQGYPNLEYIIMDGGSADSSVEIIQKYAPWLAYWISEPDRGQADAINKGFEKTTGQFLAWINSDDYFYPGFVYRRVLAFQSNSDVDFLYGDVDEGWDIEPHKRRRYGEDLSFSELLTTLRVSIPQQSCMWRRSVLENVGGLDPKWRVALDWEFFLRVGLKCRMKYLPGAVAFFRYHPCSKSISEESRWITEVPAMYDEFFMREDLPPEILAIKRQALAASHLYSARILCEYALFNAVVTELMRAYKIYPPSLFSFRFGKLALLFAMGPWGRALWRKVAKRPDYSQRKNARRRNER